MHGSPDGPWFFIIARNDTEHNRLQLIGITDTAMLRPQVFALHEGQVQVGLLCSEKQAIDATLKSLAAEDPRVGTVPDRCWNARGGSYTDGGAFIFNLDLNGRDPLERRLTCVDKFDRPITLPQGQSAYLPGQVYYLLSGDEEKDRFEISRFFELQRADLLYEYVRDGIPGWDFADLMECLKAIKGWALKGDAHFEVALEALTRLLDLRYPTFDKKRRSILQMIQQTLETIFRHFPSLAREDRTSAYRLIDWGKPAVFQGAFLRGKGPGHRCISLSPGRGSLRQPSAGRGLLSGMATVYRFWSERPAVPRVRARTGYRWGAHRYLREFGGTIWPPGSTGSRSTSTETPRTSWARS